MLILDRICYPKTILRTNNNKTIKHPINLKSNFKSIHTIVKQRMNQITQGTSMEQMQSVQYYYIIKRVGIKINNIKLSVF
ncbi:unnamed protein product (macronuclear) [Paramecium tetraurelia]|uniref:Uncharacterized protein n=1 Tax=Paramecium tetraurelia TaxID=5888 RepID=A0EEQ7_PARTE|nr:uncharacterized protein GSPATT00026120001 [Paramecium tetraurelia]CAK93798.1 unnamed protein product [Paramecium tetraurelia]|eukprot:XP_001461171.1 hypothetical protein (macronuclear) [Paramecium tetraurelia strain d4-2]